MLELFTLFILKILDCSLSTVKSIFLIKDKNFLSSLFNALSTYFYLVMLTKLNKSDSNVAVIIICTATFLGSLVPALIFNKVSKDSIFVFDIVSDTNEKGKYFADTVRIRNNLAIQTYKGYNSKKEEVLCSKVFSNNRAESKLIESLIPEGFIYNVVEIRDYKFNEHNN